MRSSISLLAVTWFVLLGCAPSLHVPRGQEHLVRERWVPSFVFGLFGESALDVRDLCASGVATGLSVGANFGTASVTVLTLGIYSPRKVWVACEAVKK